MLSCGLVRGTRHMGELPFSAFCWPEKGGLFTWHDFEGNTAQGAAGTEQSLRSRTCSSSVVLASAGADGEAATNSPLMPEENRTMAVNCWAWGSKIASSLWRTGRTARSWWDDALVNREV